MGWNYPDGVTGNEYEIAGADAEGNETDVRECQETGAEHTVNIWWEDYRGTRYERWDCPCGAEHATETDLADYWTD
jgi:hypothetical protein